jgi:DNA ligase-1
MEDIDNAKFYKPMLAKKYDDRKAKIGYPMISNPKLDGIRCVAKADGLFSRTGKPIVSCPHIYAALQLLFNKNPKLVLHGELYCDKFANDFNAICSLVRKTKPTAMDLVESSMAIQYWVYDIPSSDGTNATRCDELEDLEEKLEGYGCVQFVDQTLVKEQSELDTLYEAYINDGYEGQIIRLCDGKYEQKRSNNLLKRKEFMDAEYEIVEVIEGEGNRTGTAGAMVLKRDDGVTFKSNIKGTHSYTAELLNDRVGLVGKMATCKFFELTPDGIPRFPYVIAIRDYE